MKPFIEVQVTPPTRINGCYLHTITGIDESMLVTIRDGILKQIDEYEGRLAKPDWKPEDEYEEKTFLHSMLSSLYQFMQAIQEAKTI